MKLCTSKRSQQQVLEESGRFTFEIIQHYLIYSQSHVAAASNFMRLLVSILVILQGNYFLMLSTSVPNNIYSSYRSCSLNFGSLYDSVAPYILLTGQNLN